jgi:hypothetical protein
LQVISIDLVNFPRKLNPLDARDEEIKTSRSKNNAFTEEYVVVYLIGEDHT